MVSGLAEGQAATGVRILGPGSFGIACPALQLNATLSHLTPQPGPGGADLAIRRAVPGRAGLGGAERRGLQPGRRHRRQCRHRVRAGAGLPLPRPATGPILLDIRRIRDPRAFLSAARAAARLRPVVALRAGSRLLDPTGRAELVFDAALNRAGVLTVARFEDMLAALETLTRGPAPRAEGLAIVTNAIGPGRMAADAALASGDRPGAPGAGDARGAAPVVPRRATRPTSSMSASSSRRGWRRQRRMLAGAREVGGILAVLAPTGPADAAGVEALAAVPRNRVPLLVCAMGETTGAAHRRRLAAAGIPAFASPEQAVGGFRHLLRLRRARAAAAELPPERRAGVGARPRGVHRQVARRAGRAAWR